MYASKKSVVIINLVLLAWKRNRLKNLYLFSFDYFIKLLYSLCSLCPMCIFILFRHDNCYQIQSKEKQKNGRIQLSRLYLVLHFSHTQRKMATSIIWFPNNSCIHYFFRDENWHCKLRKMAKLIKQQQFV